MKKMTGLEYLQFMSADWDKLLNLTESYMDAAEITIDGVPEPDDITTISQTAEVVIYSGCIMANEDVDISLISVFNKWKKTQTHETFVVQIPKEQDTEFRKALFLLGGKVLK